MSKALLSRHLPDLSRHASMPDILARLRPRTAPPVNDAGIFDIGSEAFRKHAAFFEDGTLHVVKAHSDAVFDELLELRRTWHLPRVSRRVAASPVDIDILCGKVAAAARRTGVDDLEPGARRFLAVLNEAATLGASDVKFLVRADQANLRVRIGPVEITHGHPWPLRDTAQAISWIYDERALGDGSSSQKSASFQPFAISSDGHVPLPEGVVSLRGQKGFIGDNHDLMVLRLLYSRDSHDAGNLESLGLDTDVLDELAHERRSDNGLVIIGGSTGDGKSTTLVRQLERLYQDRNGQVSIYTVEDPIEYPIIGDGIGQVPVSATASGTDRSEEYSEALRFFVRINPDIGMISEIRSAHDAEAILRFVTSGHKVFTTVHSFSASNVIFRLISLGVNPKELCEPGVLSLIMRQKLVQLLCPGCKRPATHEQTHEIANWTQIPDGRPMIRDRKGCPDCLAGRSGDLARAAWGGLSRYRAVAEFIRVDDRYREFIENRDPRGARAYWTTPTHDGGMGGRTVDSRVAELVAAGEIDYFDFTNTDRNAGTDPSAGTDRDAGCDPSAGTAVGAPTAVDVSTGVDVSTAVGVSTDPVAAGKPAGDAGYGQGSEQGRESAA